MNRESNCLSELIPISAHYEPSILITKNGELVQILQVRGFSKRFDKNVQLNLRQEVKNLIKSLISKNVMFYLYVKRDYRKLDLSSDFSCDIAKTKSEMWIRENGLDSNLMNTLYIAVVHIGAKSYLSKKNILNQIFFSKFKKLSIEKLNNAISEISEISFEILQGLEKYGTTLLSIVEKNNKLISQPLSFINYLISSEEEEIEVKRVDFAKLLSFNLNLKNGYNICEFIRNRSLNIDYEGNISATGSDLKSSYMSLLTVKSGYDLSTKYTDHILTLDQQMVITETIKLTESSSYKERLSNNRKIYNILNMELGLSTTDFLLQNIDKTTKSQVSIKIVASSHDQLENNIKRTKELLYKIGISCTIEDYYMMGGFLSILPGNSHLLRREFINVVENSCTFCSIKPKSLGGYNGSIWGEPVTVFRTSEGLPFYFNFHNSSNIGHTIVVGKKEYGLDKLVSFLIFESFRFDVRVIDLFSSDSDMKLLHKSLNVDHGSEYVAVKLLKMIEYNVEEFYKIIRIILLNDEVVSGEIDKQVYELCKAIITIFRDNYQVEILISEIAKAIDATIMNSDIRNKFLSFFSQEMYFKLFNCNVPIETSFFKFNLTDAVCQNKYKRQVVAILTFFILKKIVTEVDETSVTPMIINISSDILLLSEFYNLELSEVLDELTKRHIIVIFNCSDRKTLYKVKNLSEIIEKNISLRIFLSDKFVDKEFKNLFSLSHIEVNKIKMYTPSENIFLMKQDDYSVTCSFKALNKITIE